MPWKTVYTVKFAGYKQKRQLPDAAAVLEFLRKEFERNHNCDIVIRSERVEVNEEAKG